MKPHIGLALLLAGTLGVTGTAAAQDNPPQTVEIRTLSLPYEAAELRDEQAAETLFFRIRQAAEEVCRIAHHPRGYEIWHEHACEAEAVAEAIGDVNEPALDQYYSDRGGSALSR